MGELVGATPERIRGQIGIWRRLCTPESSELIDQWTGSREPARYEVCLKSGTAVLISSRASQYLGFSCRLVQAERLGRWI